jgi:hypothetical protein
MCYFINPTEPATSQFATTFSTICPVAVLSIFFFLAGTVLSVPTKILVANRVSMQVSQDCVCLFRANMETMLVVAIIIAIIATGLGAKIHIQECLDGIG